MRDRATGTLLSGLRSVAGWLGDPADDGGSDSASEPSGFVFDGGRASETTRDGTDLIDEDALDFDDEKLLDGIGLPPFMIDVDGDVVAWNARMAALTGVSNAEVTGGREIASILYGEARDQTLASRVIESPTDADRHVDVERVEGDLTIFEAEAALEDADWAHRHYECSARPLYQDGRLAAVLQTVQDRTDETRRREAITALVAELNDTLDRIAEEVTQLANETRTPTEDISGRIETVQAQANQASAAVEESNHQVRTAGEDIDEALTALAEIADAIDEAAAGIQEVAEGNDDQADAVQDVMATIDTVGDWTDDVEAATDQIVAVMDEQERAIAELQDRVQSLTGR